MVGRLQVQSRKHSQGWPNMCSYQIFRMKSGPPRPRPRPTSYATPWPQSLLVGGRLQGYLRTRPMTPWLRPQVLHDAHKSARKIVCGIGCQQGSSKKVACASNSRTAVVINYFGNCKLAWLLPADLPLVISCASAGPERTSTAPEMMMMVV